MKNVHSIILTAAVSMIGTWFLFVQLYKPTESDFLETTTANYFQRMTAAGLNAIASYDDCRLAPSDKYEKRQGVAMFGLCQAANETTTFYYMIAMTETASFFYAGFEEYPR